MPAVRKWQLNIQWTHTRVLGQCVHPRRRSGTPTEFGVPIRSQTRRPHITTCPLPAWSRLQGTHPYAGHRTDSPGSDNHTEHPGKVGLGGVVGGWGSQEHATFTEGNNNTGSRLNRRLGHTCAAKVLQCSSATLVTPTICLTVAPEPYTCRRRAFSSRLHSLCSASVHRDAPKSEGICDTHRMKEAR